MLMRANILFILAGTALAPASRAAAQDRVDFSREVRPILSRYCFKCHGPDEKVNKAGLRLDVRELAIGEANSGLTAIVPGKLDDSELVRRIFAPEGHQVMPPPSTKQHLSDAQKETLKRWIAQGAEYQPHWAFVPPQRPPLPQVKNHAWPQTAIDYFVLARLEREGLSPAPPADPYTLIRRLSLDLIGLPPTPEEVDVFIFDWKRAAKPQAAVEKLVDRLLASPHYGERWARRWLDLARYADTNGYEQDRPRSMWPWRDWVIEALNADMPFDRFTIEQLAGDMLPKATRPQRVATGFHRNSMLNEEGGIDPLEFRFYASVDRANTTATAWLGLTLGCAQCHTHRYDPIAHQEYYQFMAFLDNADEPEMDLPTKDVDTQRRQNHEKAARLMEALRAKAKPPAVNAPAPAGGLTARFEEWLKKERARTADWTVLRPVTMKTNSPLLTLEPDGAIFVSGDITKRDLYDLTFRSERPFRAIKLEALADERLPRHGPGRVYYGFAGNTGDFFLSELNVLVGGAKVPIAKATQSFAADKFPAANATDGDPQSGWSVNGGQGEDHHAVFSFAEPFTAEEFTLTLLFERYYASDLGRFRISVSNDAAAEARNLPADIEKLLAMPTDKLDPARRQRLFDEFLLGVKEFAKEAAEIKKLRKRVPYSTTLVMQERPPQSPRATFIHKRGEFLQPTEKVTPATPKLMHAFPKEWPRDRLHFARWLMSRDNPLTARVTVNRQWQAFFGTGLVRTAEDFGLQGEAPSHPELLDWLAVEFMEPDSPLPEGKGLGVRGSPWSLKHIHRLIVMSATYQQSSRVTPEVLAKDSANRLLARFPRTRLEAELVRDYALSVSGLLSKKIGGPSVYPPQPPGVTEVAFGGMKWTPSTGADRYRRGLYTFMKRTAPYSTFLTFDGPSGESCVARRDVSNTPLQALTLLNDEAFVEAAQALGKIMAAQPGSTEQKIDYLFYRCLTRPPSAEERTAVAEFFEKQRRRFAKKDLDAAKVAGPGGGDAVERAAWTATARAILNTDEAITR
jgi:mono/diheme cytochrome c family protein